MSIFGIMASISLFNFSGFSSNISLSNLTHDVALVLREAQLGGISGLSIDSNNIESPIRRGVYFEYDTSTGEFSDQIVIFDDFITGNNNTNKYNAPDEEFDTITVQSSDTISAIKYSDPVIDCNDQFRILFQRPDPNPIVFCGSDSASTAEIFLTSSDGLKTRSISIYPTGQINVN